MAKRVKATYFDDKLGYNNINLYDGNNYYAELSKDYNKRDFIALGGLPFRHRLKIIYQGKNTIGMKGAALAGGPENPKIAIHKTLAARIGFPNKIGYVYIQNAF